MVCAVNAELIPGTRVLLFLWYYIISQTKLLCAGFCRGSSHCLCTRGSMVPSSACRVLVSRF